MGLLSLGILKDLVRRKVKCITDKEKLEIIAKDPILWMETFVSVPDKTGKVVKFKLTPEQKWLIKHKQKYNITLKSRQLGISTVAMCYSLYLTLTRPNTTCMMMSYSMKSASGIFNKLRMMLYHFS